MKTWQQAGKDSLVSGSIASALSTVALSARGESEDGTPYAPTNAISHWIHGDRALRRNDKSLRYTLTGYAIHHASSTLWAVLYEKWFGEHAERGHVPAALLGGAAVAAIACFTDYRLTPERLRPGFEHRLSSASLFLVYASFGAGLAMRGLSSAPRRH
ncbi:hypothetical protein [Noviherbaspirillum saxi]|uniref:DUF2938 domain-containing protein n=1 Tax=Noviherbaspirillum saxi TaxID=2320863 RepID=A0A3A3G0S2_9BURK|nr:hypothetical protein [Noviherbaspirillum saxi]RJF95036.1 hypothetical protein D3871_16340 [Noviherbaspirillum saxi]